MTLTDASSTAPLPSRALGLIAALPPVLIVAGAAALGYTQGPKLGPTLSGFFAPPPVAIYHAPIDNTPVAKIAPEPPPPAPQAAEVITPQPLPVGETRGEEAGRARASCEGGVRAPRAAGAPLRLSTPLPIRLCANANSDSDSVRRPRRADVRGFWRPLRSALREGAPCRKREIHNRPEAPRGYVLTLAAATAAASVGGFALWASQNMKIGQPLWWQGGSLAAALIAAKLTLAATKQRGQMRPQRSLLDSFNAKLDAAAAALSRMPESEGRRSDRNGASAKAAADRVRTRAADESRISAKPKSAKS